MGRPPHHNGYDDLPKLLPYFLIVVLFTVVASASLAWTRRRSRALRAGARMEIGTVEEATPANVRGVVACAEPLIAPFTGRPCAYVWVELYSETMGRVLKHVWTARRDFTIADSSGRAQILVERARFEIVADIVQIGRVTDLTSEQRAKVDGFRWSLPPIGPLELREAIVEVGATIDVAGVAAHELDPTPPQGERGYREGPALIPVFQGDVVISDGRSERRWIEPAPKR